MKKALVPDEAILRDYDLEIARLKQSLARDMTKLTDMEYERALYAATGTLSVNPAVDISREKAFKDFSKVRMHN